MKIREIYSRNNLALLRHIRNQEIDIYQRWWEFSLWAEHHPEVLQALSQIEDTQIDSSGDVNDLEPEVFFKLPKEMQEEFYEDFRETIAAEVMQNDPASAPTWAHMDLNHKTLLPRHTWLVHFTYDAHNIGKSGFTKGMDDMDRLGLTKWVHETEKNYGGYNFAFTANSKYVDWVASKGKYGNELVIFQNSGVECTHYGDEEDQVVFWGEDVDPRSIIVVERGRVQTDELYTDEAWCVKPHPLKRRENSHDSHAGVFCSEEITEVVKWVQSNWRQYRKIITGW
jgi:hypothetical protein